MSAIGIFGFYSWMNFGDDLMARMFADEVIQVGHKPILFFEGNELPEAFAGLEVEGSIKHFVEKCDKIMVGGGGILSAETGRKSPIFYKFRDQTLELVRKAEEMRKPLAAFSVGGNGIGGDIGLHIGIASLLTSRNTEVVTLRLESDSALIEKTGMAYEVGPDIVYSSKLAEQASHKPLNGRKLRIGLNLYDRKPDRIIKKLLNCLPGAIPITVSTGEIERKLVTSDREEIRYEGNLEDYMGKLVSLDLLITCKLHLGITALMHGIPTILFFGPQKAQACYREAGLCQRVIKTRGQAFNLMQRIITRNQEFFSVKQDGDKLNHLRDGSLIHRKVLREWLAR